uniref:Smr domain-containing protein n=1 Tax=Hyaloperonospora arabidopsidis (strain Emoy2) TaxID=559515 RepID=M4BZC7_HYAAE
MHICCSWARKGQAERSLAMMPELRDRFHQECLSPAPIALTRASVYDPLLSVFKLQGDWRSTHEAIAQMHKLGITPTIRAFRVLMLTLAKAQQTDTLLTTVAFVEKKFPSLWTDVVTLTAMCQALVRVDEHQRVLDIYSKLDDCWIREQASTMLFNQFLLAAVRNEATKSRKNNKGDRRMTWTNVPVATKIFDCMQEAQVATPDDFTFVTCMRRLENRGDWDGMLDLFDTMVVTQTRDQSALKAPLINALSCAAAVRALHMMREVSVSDQVQNADLHDATRMKKSSRSLQHKMKQDLAVVLEQIRTVDLRKIDHASTLIDTLDEFRLFTAARDTFKRVLDEGVIQKTPWRLKDGFEIDLHTFSRGVAKCAVVSAFDEITHSQQSIGAASLGRNVPLQDLRIIVGLGKRSQTFMKPVLRQEITDLLTKSSWPPLWPSMHPTNPGVLLVRHNALRKWLVKGGAIRYF